MSKLKHTPGPWEWIERDYGFYELVNTSGVIVHSDGSASGEYGPDIDVSGPDARLIAAAPDLLRACQAVRASGGLEGANLSNAIDMCCVAFKKATGE